MAANVEPERGRVHAAGDVRQVPAHVEAIIRREHALIEYFERRFEQGWPGTLQKHGALLRKVRDQVASTVDEREISGRGRDCIQYGCAEEPCYADPSGAREKSSP